MRLFDDFEAVKFPEENLIFITNRGFIFFICDLEDNFWRKHRNAGNDRITVRNYQDVSKEELMNAMGGIFPEKKTDFLRRCKPEHLWIEDLMALLKEDYPAYMPERSDWEVYHSAHKLLIASDVCYKTYLELRKLFDNALALKLSNEETLKRIKELGLLIMGRDIFREEIGIVDGHYGSSYFGIRPVRVYDYSDTHDWDTVAEMRAVEISIEEDDVNQFLTPFLYKYFDDELEANKNRLDHYWVDDDGSEHKYYIKGFEWYLTHNFYTFESMERILTDIRDTMDALSSGKENEYTGILKEKRGKATYELVGGRGLTREQIDAYNANRPTEDDTKVELIIDFYDRFLYRMEYMLRVGREKGYNLISFMGP